MNNAQVAGYVAAIIYDFEEEPLIYMGAEGKVGPVTIPSVFVSKVFFFTKKKKKKKGKRIRKVKTR